jgi:carbohydrate kinase (thermoresistant glucokinase family)
MKPTVIFVMGVSGSGKTTIASGLAEELSIPFYDADDFHSVANKSKMAQGIPLTDADRVSWLESLNELARREMQAGGAVIACSALKEKYRQTLQSGIENTIRWVVLRGEFDLIHHRMQTRKNHYMPAGLLQSQFETMEYPSYGIHISIDQEPDDLIQSVLHRLNAAES